MKPASEPRPRDVLSSLVRQRPKMPAPMADELNTQPLSERLRAALMQVIDPEVGMNIVDLGLVYDLRVAGEQIEADITMTTPSCPMGSMILDEVGRVLSAAAPAGAAVQVHLVWDPPWDPSMMSERARAHFGWG